MTELVDPARVRALDDRAPLAGAYVLYWMQQAQRVADNAALAFAIERANDAKQPLVVAFGLTDGYPEANARHYAFLLEGLVEVERALHERGAAFVLRRGAPDEVAVELASDASAVICDRGPLRHQKAWRAHVAKHAGRPVIEVESDTVVPIARASDKREFAARTLRPKIQRALRESLRPITLPELRRDAASLRLPSTPIDGLLEALDVDRTVPPVTTFFRGGAREGARRLARFTTERLARYHQDRLEPEAQRVSHLSPYLHFGQLGPTAIAIAAQEADAPPEARDTFLEELIVRRELAINYVEHEPHYDRFDALPAWARETLGKHAGDPREHVYTRAVLERARTHDPYWNAAQNEMRYTGYMHNAMRMYWGKCILAWSKDPASAYRAALALNNRYFLDGRDANSYANVGWLFGLHDRPWPERPVFGTVRTMTQSGLKRKHDADAYVAQVERQVTAAKQAGVRFDER